MLVLIKLPVGFVTAFMMVVFRAWFCCSWMKSIANDEFRVANGWLVGPVKSFHLDFVNSVVMKRPSINDFIPVVNEMFPRIRLMNDITSMVSNSYPHTWSKMFMISVLVDFMVLVNVIIFRNGNSMKPHFFLEIFNMALVVVSFSLNIFVAFTSPVAVAMTFFFFCTHVRVVLFQMGIRICTICDDDAHDKTVQEQSVQCGGGTTGE